MDVKERLKRIAQRLKEQSSETKKTRSVSKVSVLRQKLAERRKERLRERLTKLRGSKVERKVGSGTKTSLLGSRLREKLAKRLAERRKEALKEKIARLKARIARIKRSGVADAPMQYAQNLETSRTKNYAIPVKKPAIATKEDLARLKAKQEEKVPPVWRGVDLRQQLKVAWLKAINSNKNEIKADLFDGLVAVGVKEKVAVSLIEKAFRNGGRKMVEDFVKMAEEAIEMPEEKLKEEEKALESGQEVEINVTLQPDGSVEGEYEVADTGAKAEEVEEVEEAVEEVGRDEELEERLVESSVKFPKIASEERDSLLRKALPQYGVLK
jgi:hypothetical protein